MQDRVASSNEQLHSEQESSPLMGTAFFLQVYLFDPFGNSLHGNFSVNG